jgi:hypothetical protein
MRVDTLLSNLSRDLGSTLQFDDENKCLIVYEDRLEIYLESNQERELLHIYALLCPIPEASRLELYEMLLSEHLMGFGSGNAIFGECHKIGELMLFREIDMDEMDYHDFLVALQNFVKAHDFWTERIDEQFHLRNQEPTSPSALLEQHRGFV